MKKKLYWKESTKLVKLTVSHDSSSRRLTSLEIFRPTGQILHVKGKAILKTVKDYSHVNNPFGICIVFMLIHLTYLYLTAIRKQYYVLSKNLYMMENDDY